MWLHSKGKLQALLENVSLGWKLLTVTNTLAYYDISVITGTKRYAMFHEKQTT
jgi:hypothetical protein